MLAYVIKNKEGKYYKRYFDNGYIEFTDCFCFAELYTKIKSADDTRDFILRNKYRFNIESLEVAEITIAEGDLEQELETYKGALILACKKIEKEVCCRTEDDELFNDEVKEDFNNFIEQVKRGGEIRNGRKSKRNS